MPIAWRLSPAYLAPGLPAPVLPGRVDRSPRERPSRIGRGAARAEHLRLRYNSPRSQNRRKSRQKLNCAQRRPASQTRRGPWLPPALGSKGDRPTCPRITRSFAGWRGCGPDDAGRRPLVRWLRFRRTSALPAARRRRDVHPSQREAPPQQLPGPLRPVRRRPGRGSHLHLLGEGRGRRAHQQLARPSGHAGYADGLSRARCAAGRCTSSRSRWAGRLADRPAGDGDHGLPVCRR